jgi:hypothetical protein
MKQLRRILKAAIAKEMMEIDGLQVYLSGNIADNSKRRLLKLGISID